MSRGLAALQDRTRTALREAVGPAGTPVALLDYPRYLNAGDALIWQGQVNYLRDLDYPVRYVGSQTGFDADELRRRHPDGPLLITGGGNLGDRWLTHQDFRERVIETFIDRRIVQLPQSIDFRDPHRAEVARQVFDGHPDLTLLMRDQRSLTRARATFSGTRVAYCPDAAYGVGALRRLGRPSVDVVFLLRGDSEAVERGELQVPAGISFERADWGFPARYGRLLWKALRTPEDMMRGRSAPGRVRLVDASYRATTTANLLFARRIVSRGKVLVTDRLHAMVLATLSGIPVVALDNAYGKVSAVFEEYGAIGATHMAGSLDEAIATAKTQL